MKIAIIGSRTITDAEALAEMLAPYAERVTEVISGGAAGVDTLAREWAHRHGKPLREMRPNYQRHGAQAPLVRNRQIVAAADEVFILWDGSSKGTAHTKRVAEQLGKPVHERQVAAPNQLRLL